MDKQQRQNMKALIPVLLFAMPVLLSGQNAIRHLSANATHEHPGIATSPVVYTETHYFIVNEKNLNVQAVDDHDSIAQSLLLERGDTFVLQFRTFKYNFPIPEENAASPLPFIAEFSEGIKAVVFPVNSFGGGKANRYRPVLVVNGNKSEFELPVVADENIKRFFYPSSVKVNKAPMTENGAGILLPDFSKHKELPSEKIAILPPKGLTLYDAPEGMPVGRLTRFCPVGKYSDGIMRMFILPDENNNECKPITLSHLYHWSDEAYMIPFYKNEKGYVLLFNDSTLGGTWAKAADIEAQDFKLLGWRDYFIENRNQPAFTIAPGLPLREGPYADAKIIVTLKDETTEIWITGYDEGFCEGSWCKVKVKVYKENPCTTSLSAEQNLSETYEGWLKLTQDDGMPNIYLNTKGC